MKVLRVALRAERWRLVAAAVAVVLSGTIVALGPVVVRYGIDDGIAAGDRSALRLAVAGAAVLLVAGGLVGGLRSLVMVAVGQRVLHRLRSGALAGVLRLDLAEFERRSRGDVQARLTSDVESLGAASEGLLPNAVNDVVLVGGGLVALGVLAPGLLLLALVVVPPAALAGRWLLRRSRDVYPAQLRRNGEAVGALGEVLEGAPTIAALGAAAGQQDRLHRAGAALVDASLTAATMRNWFYGALLVLQSAGTAAVVVGAGVLVTRGGASVGTAAAAVLALAGVYGPLSLLIGRLDDVLSAAAAFRRVVELVDTPPTRGGDRPLPARGRLEVDAVTYTYPGADGPAVAAVSFDVDPGEQVALVGPTGSGKSTLGRLAVGLAVPDAGAVSLGGVDLAVAADDERRHRLLLVPQETFLAGGTVADNARLAHPDLDDAAVLAAADQLGLRAWIDSLPDGVATDVGPAGGRLSAGERQLVGLLRVAVADPAVVVLDEATSVLDPDAEHAVAAALGELCRGRAVLVIAHREATAARCDRVVALEAGALR